MARRSIFWNAASGFPLAAATSIVAAMSHELIGTFPG